MVKSLHLKVKMDPHASPFFPAAGQMLGWMDRLKYT